MLSKFNPFELIKDGYSEIKVSQNNIISVIFHFIIPICISAVFILLKVDIGNEVISNIISSISIFSGLLFSVIFILLENYNKRKEKINKDSADELVKYVNRYKKFTNKTTTIILFSIVIAMACIVMLFTTIFISQIRLTNIDYELIKDFLYSHEEQLTPVKSILLNILQSICIVFLYNYFLIVINLIVEIYKMIYDSINSRY